MKQLVTLVFIFKFIFPGFSQNETLSPTKVTTAVYFDLGASGDPSGMQPSEWDGATAPPTNEPNYFSYFNDWSSTTEDYLKIWAFVSKITP